MSAAHAIAATASTIDTDISTDITSRSIALVLVRMRAPLADFG
jgi:hypothetical protein